MGLSSRIALPERITRKRAILRKAAWWNWLPLGPAAKFPRAVDSSAVADRPVVPAEVDVASTDTGVATFHAFDLAAGPNDAGVVANATLGESSEIVALTEPGESQVPKAPASDPAASTPRRPEAQPFQVASALPAFAAVALLAAADVLHLEGAEADDRGGRTVRQAKTFTLRGPASGL